MSPERKEHCIKITGQVTEWVADKLIEDENLISNSAILVGEFIKLNLLRV